MYNNCENILIIFILISGTPLYQGSLQKIIDCACHEALTYSKTDIVSKKC